MWGCSYWTPQLSPSPAFYSSFVMRCGGGVRFTITAALLPCMLGYAMEKFSNEDLARFRNNMFHIYVVNDFQQYNGKFNTMAIGNVHVYHTSRKYWLRVCKEDGVPPEWTYSYIHSINSGNLIHCQNWFVSPYINRALWLACVPEYYIIMESSSRKFAHICVQQ